MKSTKYSTLRNTRPRFAYPSFNYSPKKNGKDVDMKEAMNHFSVGNKVRMEDDLILTLQKSKSNLRDETMNEDVNKNRLRRLKMDLGKITIYPNADGISLRKKKKEEFR